MKRTPSSTPLVLSLLLLPALASAQDRKSKEATIEIAPLPDWSIKKEVDRLDQSMRNYNNLIGSLSRASKDLGEEFEAYLKDPQNELLASSVERKMAIYAKTVMADFDGIIADQDLLGANFRELQRKLVAFSAHLGNQSSGYKLKLDNYRKRAKELESRLVELSVRIKEDPPEDPLELRRLKSQFAQAFRRYRLQSRYVNGYDARYRSYQQLERSVKQLASMFVNLHAKFNEMIENLENERQYLDDSIRLQADKIRIQQIIRQGILGSERAIGNVAEKLADLYNKVDAFSQVHERINQDLNNFVQSQDILLQVTRKIDAIGMTGGGLQDLAADMDKAIEAFYRHRDEPEDDKLMIDIEREKNAAKEAARGEGKTGASSGEAPPQTTPSAPRGAARRTGPPEPAAPAPARRRSPPAARPPAAPREAPPAPERPAPPP
ncbi:MAG: hypothetical protein D6731_17325, partial [Planctomycetota bacterium]